MAEGKKRAKIWAVRRRGVWEKGEVWGRGVQELSSDTKKPQEKRTKKERTTKNIQEKKKRERKKKVLFFLSRLFVFFCPRCLFLFCPATTMHATTKSSTFRRGSERQKIGVKVTVLSQLSTSLNFVLMQCFRHRWSSADCAVEKTVVTPAL